MSKWKQRARSRLALKIRQHKIRLPGHCECCQLERKIEQHHWDYDVDDFVSYLCGECHRKLDTPEFADIKEGLEKLAWARAIISRGKERKYG